MKSSPQINNIFGVDNKSKNIQDSAKRFFGMEYNPFLNSKGELINPYINYQSLLDNPKINNTVKKYISNATGLNPSPAMANSKLSLSDYKAPILESTSETIEANYTDASKTDNSYDGNSNIVSTAQKYIGTPYVWGGTTPKGFDCSGLVQYAYAQNGIKIPRTSQEQFKSGTPVASNDLMPGDLVFFKGSSGTALEPGHVGMYIGNGNIIEAPSKGKTVRTIALSQKSGYVGARRYK